MNIYLEILKSFLPSQDGYLYMWVLALLSIVALVLMVERWIKIGRITDIDGEAFVSYLRQLIAEKKILEACQLCETGGLRALPKILGAGFQRFLQTPQLTYQTIEVETMHQISLLERRINYIMTIGNTSTLLGLMGTIYGLILSFSAVANPSVDPVQKSSMLASGISAAMNTTLLGLIISVPCILIFSLLRTKVDNAIAQIDLVVRGTLTSLFPDEALFRNCQVSTRRIKEEVDSEPNIAPLMNLMVILIPLLLSSSEFVKMGAIELKLPQSSGGGEDDGGPIPPNSLLGLGVAVTKEGFSIFHYFKKEVRSDVSTTGQQPIDIALKNGEYDYDALHEAFVDVKQTVLYAIVNGKAPSEAQKKAESLARLYTTIKSNTPEAITLFQDHEEVKIVALDNTPYENIIKVMDAARGTATPDGKVTMFPTVSLAGGIAQ